MEYKYGILIQRGEREVAEDGYVVIERTVTISEADFERLVSLAKGDDTHCEQ